MKNLSLFPTLKQLNRRLGIPCVSQPQEALVLDVEHDSDQRPVSPADDGRGVGVPDQRLRLARSEHELCPNMGDGL
jgi:hypothetical protein